MTKWKKALSLATLLAAAACGGGEEDSPTSPNTPPPDSNGSPAAATALALGAPVVGTISSAADLDYYRLTLDAPTTVRIQTFDATGAACDETNDSVDTFVEVKDATGADATGCTAENHFLPCDDNGLNWCEDFTFALPAGVSYVVVSSSVPMPAFDYTLKVSAAAP